jgi:glycosyltransferase involved in cell wall biosynthesis
VVQAAHFYMNLYAALAARACGALPLGTIRSDGVKDLGDTGAWGRWLLRMPSALIVNSRAAQATAQRLGVPAEAIHLIANVLALPEGSAAESGRARQPQNDRVSVLTAGGLHQAKRFDRFIAAISAARARRPGVMATIAGAGPERKQLEAQAQSLGLLPDAIRFAGHCPDMAGAFREADIFMLTSDHEGFPNVILEAMAAGLPVITTPAGDAGRVVVDGNSGYVVDFEDVAGLADRILRLAASADLRTRLGRAGQLRVTTEYSPELLPERLLGAYRTAARRNRAAPLLASIEPPGARASEEAGCPA